MSVHGSQESHIEEADSRNLGIHVNSDMYSLGVILYEIFKNFKTRMEMLKNVEDLRNGICCPNFEQCWPQQAKAVMALTNKSPTNRPSAKDLLASGLFHSAEQQVKILKQALEKKDLALQEKDQLLQEKDKIISELRHKINCLLLCDT